MTDLYDFALTDETEAALRRFLDLLLDENTRVNLTAVRDPQQAWRRLICDSLTLLGGIDAGSEDPTADIPHPTCLNIVDVGTGGGIPGMPLAIARSQATFTLLDATGKKIRFIQEAIEKLGLTNVRAIQERAETIGQAPAHRQKYDLAVSRAVGSVAEVLEYTLPLVKVGGRVLLLKGKEAERQLDEAADALTVLGGGEVAVFEAYEDAADDDLAAKELVIISVLKEDTTPRDYPRRPGVPRSEPIGRDET